MSSEAEQAIALALEIANRRAGGEQITDEEVVRRNAHLSPWIEKELRKLKLLGSIRERVADEEAFDQPVADIRMTAMSIDGEMENATKLIQAEGHGVAEAGQTGPQQAIERTKVYHPSIRPSQAMLRVYHDDQRHFQTIILRAQRTVIGRKRGEIIVEHDSLMSSQHAEIVRMSNGDRWDWHLRDLDSTNGTYVRIDGARLYDGTELLMGSEHYRVSILEDEARLEHLVAKEVCDSMKLDPAGTWIGRDHSDQMEVFWDELLDPKHAFIQTNRHGQWHLKNVQTVNGVWLRVNELKLSRSCLFQLGEQRFAFLA
ncbi:MAG: FHA domain-containing protein [Pirellulaceae bacterium]